MKKACLFALTLILVSCGFIACKKQDDAPKPIIPADTTVKACLPLTETDSVTGRVLHSYTYDAQRRPLEERYFDHTESNGQEVFYTYTNSYNGDTIVSVGSNTNLIYPRRKFIRSGSRISKIIYYKRDQSAPDTMRLIYEDERLTEMRWQHNDRSTESSLITYGGALPAKMVQLYLDSNGTVRGSTTYEFTYDTRKTGYSTFNLFSLAPGLNLIDLDRQVIRVAVSQSSGSYNLDFKPTYNADGNPLKVKLVSAGPTSQTFLYTYNCP